MLALSVLSFIRGSVLLYYKLTYARPTVLLNNLSLCFDSAFVKPSATCLVRWDDDDGFTSEDGASACANEEDAGHGPEAAHFGRGRLSQKRKQDLINWRDEGKTVDWIVKQLDRRKEKG